MKFEDEIYEDQGYITEFGCIDIDILNEEEFGNYKPNKGSLLHFHVYPKEGKIPHFHVFTKDHSFETCLKFEVAEYFPHGGKYTDRFKSNQLKSIDKYLNSNVPHSQLKVWEYGAIMWNSKNGANKTIYLENISKPNYKNTK